METISAKTIDPVAAGPAGHGIFAEMAADVNVDDNTQGVTAQVNQASVARAKAVAEHKILSKAPPALRSRGSFSSMRAASAKLGATRVQYNKTFAKQGLDKSIDRVMSRAPIAKATTRPGQPAPQQKGAPQLARIQSQLDSLDAMFKLIPPTKVIPVNGATLNRIPADSRRRRYDLRTVLANQPDPRRLHTLRETFNIAATGQTADSHARRQRMAKRKLEPVLNASLRAAPSFPGIRKKPRAMAFNCG